MLAAHPPGTPASPSSAEEQEQGLWHAWRESGDQGAREELVTLHLEFARILAAKLYAARHGNALEFAEYFQFAVVGLLESVERYDPRNGASFRTFSAQRINGAMLDGLAKMTEQQRQVSVRQRLMAERSQSLGTDHGKLDTGGHIFERLAETAIGLALSYMLEDSTMFQAQEPVDSVSVYANLELRQLQQQIRGLVQTLPERERLVITYHYLHQLQFETIAGILSLSKGRISQLHKNALKLLREAASRIERYDLAW